VKSLDRTNQGTVSIAAINTGFGYDVGHSGFRSWKMMMKLRLLRTDRGYIKQHSGSFGRSERSDGLMRCLDTYKTLRGQLFQY
jgi:hypothetical protein